MGPTCEQYFIQFPQNPETKNFGGEEGSERLLQATLIYLCAFFNTVLFLQLPSFLVTTGGEQCGHKNTHTVQAGAANTHTVQAAAATVQAGAAITHTVQAAAANTHTVQAAAATVQAAAANTHTVQAAAANTHTVQR